ncbi:MFS transporter [Jeotgalibacillus proteolyticus]|uniref:MFS transporter n=1 Tax=Jeotgalibacillus proteolyticus TaxID=2082395 RepID=UPI003CEED76B
MDFFTFNRTIKIRMILQFLTVLGTMSVMPYVVIFFAEKLGSFVTGFMFLGVMLASVAGALAGGIATDRKGRKKVIVFSEAVVFAGFACIAAVNSPWLDLPYVTFGLFVLVNFCTGLSGPAYQALIVDETNPNNRKKVYTFAYWLNNVGLAIGGMIGAFLFQDYSFYLFLGVSGIILVSLVMTSLFIKDRYVVPQIEYTSVGNKESISNVWHIYIEVLKNKAFAALAVANLLFISVDEQLTNFIGIRLSNEIADPVPLVSFLAVEVGGVNLLGILKTENTLIVVALSGFIAYLLKKLRDRSVLLWGTVLYFLSFAVISFHHTPIVLIIAMLIATIGELMHIPVKQTLLANIIPDHARGVYLSLYGLMAVGGSAVAGLFIFGSGLISPYVLTGCIVLAGIAVVGIYGRLMKKEQRENVDSIQQKRAYKIP